MRAQSRQTPGVALAILAALALPGTARAGGFEYTAAGTRALARGGAFAARADDPMALGVNPAALAELPGYQLMLNSHLAFYDACVQRSGTYLDNRDPVPMFTDRFGDVDPATGGYGDQPYDPVCRSGYPGPSPNLIFTARLLPEFGIGFGVMAPAGVGNGIWGNPDGTITNAMGQARPSPIRYSVVETDLLLFHPTIGIGVRPAHWLRFGVSFQWGIATVRFVNHTSSSSGLEDPGEDVRTELSVEDLFVPAVIASVHIVPIDSLDIVLHGRVSDGIDAQGSLNLTTGAFGDGGAFGLIPEENFLPGARLQAGQPWTAGLALRYGHRIRGRPRDPARTEQLTRQVEDHMLNESWDVEIDAVYTYNGEVDDFVVTPPAGAQVTLREGAGTSLMAPLPGRLPIPHGWVDQVSVRLGGQWNALPGFLAIMLGGHFETSGLSASYLIPDQMPGLRFGVHAGVTLRIARFDISIAYAHIWQETAVVTDADFRMIAAMGSEGVCGTATTYDPSQPVSTTGCWPAGAGAVVNAGTYSADWNVLSLQVGYHFE